MDFLSKRLPICYFRGFFGTAQKPLRRPEFTRFEGYLELLYKVFNWEDASLTLTVFLVINLIFWAVVQLQVRLFGVGFIAILGTFIADYYFETNNLINDQTLYLDALEKLKIDIIGAFMYMKALRKDNPASFCAGMCAVFLIFGVIAKNISGYVISYLSILAIFFVPLILKHLPQKYVTNIKQFIRSVSSERDVLAEEELIPYFSDKDFNNKDTDDLESLLTSADSGNNSLISELTSMPSYLDADDGESIQEEDLLPVGTGMYSALAQTPDNFSSDSDSDHKEINFDSSHFKGDQLSEETLKKYNILKTLTDDKDAIAYLMNAAGSLAENIGKYMGMREKADVNYFLSKAKDSSSDSDFEIINSDEIEER